MHGRMILLPCVECGRDTYEYLEHADEALCDRCEEGNDEWWEARFGE